MQIHVDGSIASTAARRNNAHQQRANRFTALTQERENCIV